MFDLAQLFQLTARDIQLDPLAVIRRALSQTAAASPIQAIFTVPDDRVLWLQHYLAYANPGATQTISGMQVYAQLRTGNNVVYDRLIRSGVNAGILGSNVADSTNAITSSSAQPKNILLMPSETVIWEATFSAAVNPNIHNVYWQGILLPRGNFSFA